jgi:membrane protein implicated in regulation of membrane protease activity
MTILWWHWLVLGLILALAELATAGGFYIIFFGVAAFVVGVLAALGIAGPMPIQLLLFAVLSIISLALFRSRMLVWVQGDAGSPPVHELVGEIGVAVDDIPPGGIGRIELRGTTWSARNGSPSTLMRGTRCRATRVEGLTLHVLPEGVR